MTLLEELREQRWDDHRYYHHSRINQSLHLLSAISFLVAYGYIVADPIISAFLGWLVAMTSRQIGHFFFEPRAYDRVNNVSHDHKERIKIGYNLQRKRVLLSIWGLSPVLVAAKPDLFGLLRPWQDLHGYLHNLSIIWLCIGGGALIGRTVQLFVIRDVRTGLVWLIKILTDPFNDVRQYYRAPFRLAQGELVDPMSDVTPRSGAETVEASGFESPQNTESETASDLDGAARSHTAS
jgi:hypothetical protein